WLASQRRGISLSLAPQTAPFPSVTARAFFGGLLPEGAARRHISQTYGVDDLDDIALLRLIGHECAGAIRVTSTPVEPGSSRRLIRWMEPDEVRELIHGLRVPGTTSALDRYSISLAGAQLKRGLIIDRSTPDLTVGVPEADALSTDIVKLAVAGYAGIVENEHCMQLLAATIGLRASTTHVDALGGERVLSVTRYDRTVGPTTERLHQEDMCQALGRLSTHKYEKFDPVTGISVGPTIHDMVTLLRARAVPSIQQVDDLLRLVWFNVIIGNIDAHAKNYSLLYAADMRSFEVAPLYDAICVSAYHAGADVAMRHAEEPLVMHIGGQTRFWQLTRADIEGYARDLGIQPAFVVRQLKRLIDAVDSALDGVIDAAQQSIDSDHPMLDVVRTEIHARCAFLRALL
ncbi:MAG: HipA domain-containing protein, partial [Thermoleophilia bacterium]|nr:HipA domain-containing protein [Thermoleophilia bacterium]